VAEKVVSVRLQARVEGFTAGMRKAKASVDDLTKADVPKAAKGYSDLANKAALAGAAIAVGLGAAVKRFADFDKAMSAVAANTGAAGEELEALRQSAIKLGADSQFSATEAAQGVNELAKAGVAAADILGGGLKGSLDLAAAGQIEVAQAAETTASALTQFGLEGGDAVHVADLLASGANKAQGGVGDLGAALNQTGLIASAMGLSIEETVGGLTAFASAGLTGSDAGTSFKTMIQRLQAPVGDAAQMLKKYNISAYDAQGNFVGLANVAGQLNDRFRDLTPEVRNNAMAVIFGSDAVRASNILYEQGAEGINKWVAAVDQQGAAAEQAAKLTDNLTGDIERLGGAFDSVLIQTGSGANDSLRTLVQGMQGLVETVGKVPGPVLLAGTGLAALALGVPKGISAFKNYQATLDSVGLSFEKLSARGPRAAKGMNLAATAAKTLGIALAGVAVADMLIQLDELSLGVQQFTSDLASADDVVSAIDKTFADAAIFEGGTDLGIKSLGDALNATFDPSVGQKAENVIGSVRSLWTDDNLSSMGVAAQRLKDIDSELTGLVTSGAADEAGRQFDAIAAYAEDQGISLEQLQAKFPQYAEALAGVDNAQKLAAGSGGKLAGATEDIKAEAITAEEALDNLKDALDGLGSSAAQQRAAERAFQAAVDDATASVKDNGRTLDEHTEKGRANQAALDDIAKAAKEKATADFEAAGGAANLEAATAAGTRAMKQGRDAFIAAAVEAGATKTEAKKLADQLGLIPKNVAIAVSQSGAEEAANAINNAAVDRNSTIWVTRKYRGTDLESEFQGVGGRATGGAIYGPGTGTSDTAGLYRLSNGEHVLTAAEVAKLGGQSAVYSLRKAIMSGSLPGYARGGAVPNYAPPAQYVMGGPTSHKVTNDNGLHAQQVTIVTPDADSFRRKLRSTSYNAKARPGR
jgi:TP901 family phage tail tape measure protein